MNTIADLIGPIYQKLLRLCEQRQIAIGLDLENPAAHLIDFNAAKSFLESEINRALKTCKKGNHIILATSKIKDNPNFSLKLSVKYNGKTLSETTKTALKTSGLDVHSRFGYDNIVSLKLR